jgi:hypothetical protein
LAVAAVRSNVYVFFSDVEGDDGWQQQKEGKEEAYYDIEKLWLLLYLILYRHKIKKLK